MRCTVQTLSLRRAWQALCSCQSHLGLSIVLTLTALFCPLSLGIIVRMRWRNCFVQPLLRVPSASMIIEVLSSRCKAAPIRWWKVGNTQCICVLTSLGVFLFSPPKCMAWIHFGRSTWHAPVFSDFSFGMKGKWGITYWDHLCVYICRSFYYFFDRKYFLGPFVWCVYSVL